MILDELSEVFHSITNLPLEESNKYLENRNWCLEESISDFIEEKDKMKAQLILENKKIKNEDITLNLFDNLLNGENEYLISSFFEGSFKYHPTLNLKGIGEITFPLSEHQIYKINKKYQHMMDDKIKNEFFSGKFVFTIFNSGLCLIYFCCSGSS